MKKFLEKQKGSNGITLIALVITIIVLLILAAISIATLTGENGILTKASKAGKDTNIAEETEIIKLAYNDLLTENIVDKTEITSSALQEKISKYKTVNIEEVEEIPEGSNVIDNGVSEGAICKITMDNIHYLLLGSSGEKRSKFYIELYDGEVKVTTLSFNFEEGMDMTDWCLSDYSSKLEDLSYNYYYPGDWQIGFYIFRYGGSGYSFELTVMDNSGFTDEAHLTDGKVFKAYKD